MRKMTIQPKDEQQLQEWIEKLNAAQVWHQVQEENGEIRIELAEASAKRVLGIQPEAPTKKMRLVGNLIVLGFLLFVVTCSVLVSSDDPEPWKDPATMSREELTTYFEKKFGFYSDWNIQYGQWVKKNYCNYPRTYRTEMVQIYPITPDSMTYVMLFSAENAFKQRTDHSITSVIDSSGNLMRVVSFQ